MPSLVERSPARNSKAAGTDVLAFSGIGNDVRSLHHSCPAVRPQRRTADRHPSGSPDHEGPTPIDMAHSRSPAPKPSSQRRRAWCAGLDIAMLKRADFTTIIAANSDWATFPATIDIPSGWLPLVEKILDTMAAVARETGCRLDIVDIQKRLHQLEFRWRGRIDGDGRAIIRDVIVRAAFRSQGTCEVCGERGWMHVDEFHSGFAVSMPYACRSWFKMPYRPGNLNALGVARAIWKARLRL